MPCLWSTKTESHVEESMSYGKMGAQLHDSQEFDDYDEECYECGGEGFIVAECLEDSCCCLDPEEDHGLIPCPVCNSKAKP